MDKTFVELIIQVGPYIAPIFLTQSLKTALGIPRRVVPVVPYVIALILVGLRALTVNEVLSWMTLYQILYESAIIGSISIALYNIFQKTIKGK